MASPSQPMLDKRFQEKPCMLSLAINVDCSFEIDDGQVDNATMECAGTVL
jgi:hypothetical protein